MSYKPGDKVQWVRAFDQAEVEKASGFVVQTIPSDSDAEEFNLYEIQFPFGLRTLYGTQIDRAV